MAEMFKPYSMDAPPPSYNVAMGGLGPARTTPLHGLTAVDFHVNGAKFSHLIALANNWLKDNIMWQVKKCETVCFPSNAGIADVQKMTYKGSTFAKCLRLWLSPRLYPHAIPQQIASFAIVPNVENPNAVNDDIQHLVQILNEKLIRSGLNGHILTVEADVAKISKRSVNPEDVLYVEGGNTTKILRVYYELGQSVCENIATFVFYPQPLPCKTPNGVQLYEDFSRVMENVCKWCSAQIINICNIQSLPAEVIYGGEKVTLRTVRLFTLQSSMPSTESYSNLTSGPLTSKMFLPVQLTESLTFRHWNEPPLFETMKQTLVRINAWAKNNGVKIVSAETCAVKLTDDPQSTALSTTNKADSFHIWVIRAYVDGSYSDPDAAMCPEAFLKWQQQMKLSNSNQEQCVLS